jgi:hypothetical protein
MSRRIALPGADELFRATGDSPRAVEAEDAAVAPLTAVEATESTPAPLGEDGSALEEAASSVRTAPRRRPRSLAERRPSGRERHDEKITVYVSADELMDLEHARLGLRGDFGLSVDRGRVVREALAVVLADFEAKGDASILVRRLRGR